MPRLKGDAGFVFRVRQIKIEALRIIEKPSILLQMFELLEVFFSADAVDADEINRLKPRRAMLTVSGKRHPLHGFANRIIVILQIIDEQIQLIRAGTITGFDVEPLAHIFLHSLHHGEIGFINIRGEIVFLIGKGQLLESILVWMQKRNFLIY